MMKGVTDKSHPFILNIILNTMEKFRNSVELIKLWLAVGLCIFGCCLLVAGFIVAPLGLIHQSVLIAFGEVITFSGAILGINYAYQSKVKSLEMKIEEKKADNQ